MLLRAARVSSTRAHRLVESSALPKPLSRWYSAAKYSEPVRLRGPILAPHSFTPSQLPPSTPETAKPSDGTRSIRERDPNLVTLDQSRRIPRQLEQRRTSDRTPLRQQRHGKSPRIETTPYKFSKKVQQWIDQNKPPFTQRQVEQVIDLVNDAPLDNVNAAVYNLVFALLGREGKFQKMWKLFNSMKKRNVKPTSRTFTTLLNAYAQVAHSGVQTASFTPAERPEQLTLDRVRVIYEQSQRHIKSELEKSQPEDTGLDLPQEAAEDVNEVQVNIRPTNAYLKFLGRYGMWNEMQEVFLGMDPIGPLSPDQVTYSTMFHAINNIDHYRRSATKSAVKPVRLPEIQTGPTSRLLWDQAVRGLTSPKREPGRYLDENLALVALQCFVAGRPEDARLVETLIPQLWGLAAPGKPGVASAAAPQRDTAPHALPEFKLTVRSATALLSLLARMQRSSLAAHYTHLILDIERLQDDFDLPLLRVAIHNLCAMHDVEAATNVIDMYSPCTGKDGWPLDVLHALLSAARWSKDWDAALDVFRRFTFLPPGVEDGAAEGRYDWKTPNGRSVDVRGKKWVRPLPKKPDVRAMDLLVRAALSTTNLKPMRQALNIFTHTGPWYATTIDGKVHNLCDSQERLELTQTLRRQITDLTEMARNVQSVAERVLEYPKDDAEKASVGAVLADTNAFLKRWGGVDLKKFVQAEERGETKSRPKSAESENEILSPRKERRAKWYKENAERLDRDLDERASSGLGFEERPPARRNRDWDERPPRRDREWNDRPPRRDRDRDDRPPRRDREWNDRPPRRDREWTDRPPRRDREWNDRPPRRDREWGDRPPRRDRDGDERPPRSNRPWEQRGSKSGRPRRDD